MTVIEIRPHQWGWKAFEAVQKVSAQLELSKTAPQTVLNNQ
jgi:hypothetical protein